LSGAKDRCLENNLFSDLKCKDIYRIVDMQTEPKHAEEQVTVKFAIRKDFKANKSSESCDFEATHNFHDGAIKGGVEIQSLISKSEIKFDVRLLTVKIRLVLLDNFLSYSCVEYF
jgi:hypothetical protein